MFTELDMKFLPGEARHCALDLCESVHQHSGRRQPLDVGNCKAATGLGLLHLWIGCVWDDESRFETEINGLVRLNLSADLLAKIYNIFLS